jgi:hypothetical protein
LWLIEQIALDPLDILNTEEQQIFDNVLVSLFLKENDFAQIDGNVVKKDLDFFLLLEDKLI